MSETHTRHWRLIDTGVLRAAQNFAYNRALLECHQENRSPNTLRFLRFKPSALIGFHQDVRQEIYLDYCLENGIDVQRRLTGGGALYFDEGVLGWELYLDKKSLGTAQMPLIAEKICTAVASGLSQLGVDARFRPRNDIEIHGKKISGTGGAFDGDSILYQGTVLVDFDIEKMLNVLHIPVEKWSDKAINSARERITTLKEEMEHAPQLEEVKEQIARSIGDAFQVDLNKEDDLLEAEKTLYEQALNEIDSPDWIYQHNRPRDDSSIKESITKTPGGLIRIGMSVDKNRSHLKQIWITGDFFIKPRRVVLDLEAALKDTPLSEMETTVRNFFNRNHVEMLQLKPEDFISAIKKAMSDDTVTHQKVTS